MTHLNRRCSFLRQVVMMSLPAKFKGMQVACPKIRSIYHVRLPQYNLAPVCITSSLFGVERSYVTAQRLNTHLLFTLHNSYGVLLLFYVHIKAHRLSCVRSAQKYRQTVTLNTALYGRGHQGNCSIKR